VAEFTRLAARLAYARAHAYDPDPRDSTTTPVCLCQMTRRYRAHQPLWWRILRRKVQWR
jgi:hypothetical protein